MVCNGRDRLSRAEKYIDHRMSDAEVELFEIHILECAGCYNTVSRMLKVTELIKKEGEKAFAPVKPSSWDLLLNKTAAYVASLFQWPNAEGVPALNYSRIAYALSLLLFFTSIPPTAYLAYRDYQTMQQYGHNFEAHPVLAKESRSAAGVKLIRPTQGENCSGPIHFRWEIMEDAGINPPFTILIFNKENKNNEIHKAEVDGNEYLFSEKLDPGLYYWVLQNAERGLLKTGHFYYQKPFFFFE